MTNTLLEKLKEASDTKPRQCKYAQILSKLDPDTKIFIEERISLPHKHPNKLSYATLSRVLKSENYLVGTSTIGDHYNSICGCKSMEEVDA